MIDFLRSEVLLSVKKGLDVFGVSARIFRQPPLFGVFDGRITLREPVSFGRSIIRPCSGTRYSLIVDLCMKRMKELIFDYF